VHRAARVCTPTAHLFLALLTPFLRLTLIMLVLKPQSLHRKSSTWCAMFPWINTWGDGGLVYMPRDMRRISRTHTRTNIMSWSNPALTSCLVGLSLQGPTEAEAASFFCSPRASVARSVVVVWWG
jgi:hypothetical protein